MKFSMLPVLLLLPGLLLAPSFFPGAGRSGLGLVAEASAEGTKYTCGMHPMIVVDEPGLCPICMMDLTTMKADGNNSGKNSGHVIQVDPVTSQKMGIRTALVEKRQLSRQIETVGLVSYQEPKQFAISSKIAGWVEKLFVNEAGQRVKKGQPLLEIYSPDLVAAQEELLLAVDNRNRMSESSFPDAQKDAERLLDAARRRLRLWDIDQPQISALEKTGKVLKTLTLSAPAKGVVSRKQVREGEFVTAGRELLEISDISELWLNADVYEYELPWVREGQQALVRFPFSSEPIRGRITTIYPYLEARTRTVKARIDLPNSDFALKPDMYADVTIITDPITDALSIPAEAILYTGKSETVFVALGEGHFEPRQITVGVLDADGYAEVRDGLSAGERVVTSAQFLLDSESKLREAIQKMLEPEAPAEEESLDDLF